MDFDYDVVIIGAFSGAATRQLIKRKAPKARRELYDSFSPGFRVTKLFWKGLLRWWKAELTNLWLMFASTVPTPEKESSAVTPAQA